VQPASHDVDEARLRAAVVARAPDLRSCAVPPGAPSQVPVQMAIRASGEVRNVRVMSREAVPSTLATCLHERLLRWRFDDVHLSSDIHLFTAFALR
jgi:hypothetical protein